MNLALNLAIEQTNLKPDARLSDIEQLVHEARAHFFKGVCVHPKWLPELEKLDPYHDFLHITVVGFPLGVTPIEVLRTETRWCRTRGADEIDMVIDRGLLMEGNLEAVKNRVYAVKETAEDKAVKVILESGELSRTALNEATRCAIEAGADFVKTSTGFFGSGATVEAVRRMRRLCPEHVGVKASGGIRSYGDAVAMLQAGATRLGTSSGVAIMEGAARQKSPATQHVSSQVSGQASGPLKEKK